jgi:hypothetical protein
VELRDQIKVGLSEEPLALWTTEIESLSLIKRDDIADLYESVLGQLDSKQFKNVLSKFPALWLKGPGK